MCHVLFFSNELFDCYHFYCFSNTQCILIVFSDENDKINKIPANNLISNYHNAC